MDLAIRVSLGTTIAIHRPAWRNCDETLNHSLLCTANNLTGAFHAQNSYGDSDRTGVRGIDAGVHAGRNQQG